MKSPSREVGILIKEYYYYYFYLFIIIIIIIIIIIQPIESVLKTP